MRFARQKEVTRAYRSSSHESTRLHSPGPGTLVGLYLSAKKANCEIRLVNLSEPVRDLPGLSDLWSVFEACGRAGTRLN
jgi:hypothetical protein